MIQISNSGDAETANSEMERVCVIIQNKRNIIYESSTIVGIRN